MCIRDRSENIFEIASLPKSIILLGGGYKSCEFAHFFSAMGVKVSIIQRNVRLLPEQEPEIGYVVEKKLGEHVSISTGPVSYTHLRAHETVLDLVCRLLLEKKNKQTNK